MMKNSQIPLKPLRALFLISLIALIVSCQKDEPIIVDSSTTDEPSLKCTNQFGLGLLLDYELVNSMTIDQIKSATGPAFASLINYDVNMYKVSYLSRYEGQIVTVSGVIGIPDTEINTSTPIVMYNHGTRVSEADLVPSSGMDLLTVVAAANGKICLAADYVGYGDSKHIFPPYVISTADIYPVCDMILAGKQFLFKEYRIYGKLPVTMFGYSQGGPITLAVQRELESNPFYKWFVKLKGVASGTGPYDLHDNTMWKIISGENYTGPVFILFSLISYNNYYNLGYELDELFQNNFGQQFLEMKNNGIPYTQMQLEFPTNIDELLQPEFRSDFIAGETPFNYYFEQNNTYKGWVPKSPLRIYHSKHDEIVPYENAKLAFETFDSLGVENVELISYENINHVTTAFMSIFEILEWSENN